jgi:hypothetical protein
MSLYYKNNISIVFQNFNIILYSILTAILLPDPSVGLTPITFTKIRKKFRKCTEL